MLMVVQYENQFTEIGIAFNRQSFTVNMLLPLLLCWDYQGCPNNQDLRANWCCIHNLYCQKITYMKLLYGLFLALNVNRN